jgi:branched-chain amino acid transport system ATP-binding protein
MSITAESDFEPKPPGSTPFMLECIGLVAGHGGVPVVHGLDLAVAKGSVLAILGPNGSGKTTTLETIAGLLPRVAGTIRISGVDLPAGDPVRANAAGAVLVPDDRALFNSLTVEQNLALAARQHSTRPRDLLDLFPALQNRWRIPAGALSGGEQQMLAVARGLVQEPKVLLIDEMSMGLAPLVVERLLPVVRTIAIELGAAVVLVEQHVALALEVADHAVVIAHGQCTLAGPASDVAANLDALERAYLGGT